MVEFSNARLTSYEDKTNPAGRRLELEAAIEEGNQTAHVQWIDTNGDGVVSLDADHYVDRTSPKQKRVDFSFVEKYKRAIDSYVSNTLYEAVRELNNYFYNLPSLGAQNSMLRQSNHLEDQLCTSTNGTFSYTVEQCKWAVTDLTIYDQSLPYTTERKSKFVSLEFDSEKNAFSIDMTGLDPKVCSNIDSCCSDFDEGYHFTVVGNSPDANLIKSAHDFFLGSTPKLDLHKSNGYIYPSGCPM